METMSKIFGTRAAEQPDPSERKARFIISAESVDSHGTVLKLGGWKLDRYAKNPIVLYQHDWYGKNPNTIIGKGRVYIEDGYLMGEVEFEPKEINELAETVFQKVLFGSLNATSVGFQAERGHWGAKEAGEDPNVFYFDEQELLEWSIVTIPSNADAVKRSAEIKMELPSKPNEEKSFSLAAAKSKIKILTLNTKKDEH